jgi:hypothetical protein
MLFLSLAAGENIQLTGRTYLYVIARTARRGTHCTTHAARRGVSTSDRTLKALCSFHERLQQP